MFEEYIRDRLENNQYSENELVIRDQTFCKEDFVDGLENAPEAFMGLLKGKNFGKLIVRTSEDPTI